MDFSSTPLFQAIPLLKAHLETHEKVTFQVLNPDLGVGLYAGEEVRVGESTYLHHPLRVWFDLADRLECHLLVPEKQGNFLHLTCLKRRSTGRDRTPSHHTEKYGADSSFQRVHKLEEPHFLLDMLGALKSLDLPADARILDLGVNSGEELRLLDLAYPQHHFEVLGIDHSESALNLARSRFPQHRFLVADINNLPADLGTFDLVLSIGTLQSANIEVEPVFRRLLKHLKPGGNWLLAFPNSRYADGDLSYGARMVNYRDPELSLLFKDVLFFRRYFQKHRYAVNITGKYYILVTARALSRV